MIKLYKNDCLIEMKNISDKSIDLILCDLPYEQTARNKWDLKLPFAPLWAEYKRIIKDNGAIILFANGMFTAELMMSNRNMWRYNLIWEKTQPTGFLNAKRMPLRNHEDICVFIKNFLFTILRKLPDIKGKFQVQVLRRSTRSLLIIMRSAGLHTTAQNAIQNQFCVFLKMFRRQPCIRLKNLLHCLNILSNPTAMKMMLFWIIVWEAEVRESHA